MKTGIVTTLIALCLPVSVFATTLRLSTDVDLLVLDGKKVSSRCAISEISFTVHRSSKKL